MTTKWLLLRVLKWCYRPIAALPTPWDACLRRSGCCRWAPTIVLSPNVTKQSLGPATGGSPTTAAKGSLRGGSRGTGGRFSTTRPRRHNKMLLVPGLGLSPGRLH